MPFTTPCIFTFDPSPAFAGFTDGTTWNGFSNVAVTKPVRDAILAYWAHESGGHDYGGIGQIPPGPDGLYSLAYGYATVIMQPTATIDEIVALARKAADLADRDMGGTDEGIDAQNAFFEALDGRIILDRFQTIKASGREIVDEGILDLAASFSDLDASCKLIQDYIGVTAGDLAGIMFSGFDRAWPVLTPGARYLMLRTYMRREYQYEEADRAIRSEAF